MKPEGIALETSAQELQARSFIDTPAPSWSERMFSVSHRVTRRDFILVLALVFLIRVASISVLFGPLAAFGLGLYVISLILLLITAGKRARDMGYNQWWGVLSVFIVFGVVILVFGAGDKGPNQFGPDPRRTKEV